MALIMSRNLAKSIPLVSLLAKLCTEASTSALIANVPKTAVGKIRMLSKYVQECSIGRLTV